MSLYKGLPASEFQLYQFKFYTKIKLILENTRSPCVKQRLVLKFNE